MERHFKKYKVIFFFIFFFGLFFSNVLLVKGQDGSCDVDNSGNCEGKSVGEDCLTSSNEEGICAVSSSRYNTTICYCKKTISDLNYGRDDQEPENDDQSSSSSTYSATCIPEGCPNDYIPDFECVNEKILNPSSNCCENKCRDSESTAGGEQVYEVLFTFFGTGFSVNPSQKIPALINLAISTGIGLAAGYALLMGIYVASWKIPHAEDPSDEYKTLQNLAIGFFLAVSTIFIIQAVASVLGLGSLSNFDLTDGSGPAVTITSDQNV